MGTPSEALPRFVAPTPADIALAASIVDSHPVVSAYAACEWDCLDENGQIWIAAIVREARAPSAKPANDFAQLERTCAIVDQLAAKLASADGLIWDEPCGYGNGGDGRDSGTSIAAHYEDHDPDVARASYLRYARHALAFTGRVASREAEIAAARAADPEGQPDGTRESLATCATMLETYAPDCFPPNENGQVDFARCMMDATAFEIRAFLAAPIILDSTKTGGQG